MAFDGSEGNEILETRAIELTSNYREANPGKVLSCFLGRNILQKLLAQDCQGIRFYYGLDGATPHLVAVGADENENDQLGGNFIIADEGALGPPRSGQANVLNQ